MCLCVCVSACVCVFTSVCKCASGVFICALVRAGVCMYACE